MLSQAYIIAVHDPKISVLRKKREHFTAECHVNPIFRKRIKRKRKKTPSGAFHIKCDVIVHLLRANVQKPHNRKSRITEIIP